MGENMRMFCDHAITKKLLIGIVFLCVFPVPSANAAEVNRIGVVDVQRVFQSSEGGKKVEAEIRSQFNKLQAELQKKSEELEEMKKRFEREALVMDKLVREEKQRELRIKTNDFKSMQAKYSEDLKTIEARLGGRLQKELLRLVEKIGKEEGFTIIIEKRSILYSVGTIDVTDRVIPLVTAGNIKID
jgi:outer membrane protein